LIKPLCSELNMYLLTDRIEEEGADYYMDNQMEMDIDTMLKEQNTSTLRIMKGDNLLTAYVMLYQMIATNNDIITISEEFRQCMKFICVLSRCKKQDVRELACTILEKLTLALFKKIHHNMEATEKEGTSVVLYTLTLLYEFSFKQFISTRIHDIDQKIRSKVMQVVQHVTENGYYKNCLHAFHILKSENDDTQQSRDSQTQDSVQFRSMNAGFKSFEWTFELLKLSEKKICDKNQKIAVQSLKIIQSMSEKLLVEIRPLAAQFSMMDEMKKVHELLKEIKKICLFLIDQGSEALAGEAYHTLLKFSKCYLTEDLIGEREQKLMVRAIVSTHWPIRQLAARNILEFLVMQSHQSDVDKKTVPIDSSLIAQITYILKYVLEFSLKEIRVLDSIICEEEILNYTPALIH